MLAQFIPAHLEGRIEESFVIYYITKDYSECRWIG